MTGDHAQSIRAVESGFGRPRILVVGDLMLDKYIWGEVDRISPEAPVPVLRSDRQSQQPGGAANVAMNLAGLGASVSIVGFGGGDEDQSALEMLLTEAGVSAQVVANPAIPTTTKLRVLAGQQQLLRIDREGRPASCDVATSELLEKSMAELRSASVLVFSDYAKGVLSERVCRALIAEARRLHIPVVVDPKGPDFTRYHGATTICPNAKELAAATGESHRDLEWLLPMGQKMVAALNLQHMLVTLGEKGIVVLRQDSCHRFAADARQVFDVSGAGDTVSAVIAVSLSARLPIEMAVRLANLAAGIVIGRVGTVPIHREDLLAALSAQNPVSPESKLMPLDVLRGQVAAWKMREQKIVFTNGCFDLLHAGHVCLLEQARRMGNRLIVAVNSDRSVRGLKGWGRPVVGEEDRARVLAALAVVDAVVIFDDATPLRLIEELQPDVLVKGGDYAADEVAGAAEVRTWGGRLELVPLVAGCSTTKLIERTAEPAPVGAPA